MKPESIRDISIVRAETVEKSFSPIYSNSFATESIDRTSPHEPLAMNRKFLKSLLVWRSNPSAMLFMTEMLARSTWFLKEKSLQDLKLLYTNNVIVFAFCHARISSNRSIFMLPYKLYNFQLYKLICRAFRGMGRLI